MNGTIARRRVLRGLLGGVIAVVFAAAGGAVAAPKARALAMCEPDTKARGLASRPATESPVSVRRADGRIEQFQQFYDDTAASYLPFVWHRSQQVPGGPYGDWARVSAVPVGPKLYQVGAVENRAGGLEMAFSYLGGFCHTLLPTPDGDWSTPEGFGLSPAPYHGGIVFFTERDGRLHAFASSRNDGTSMEVRSQGGADGTQWGPVRPMGKVPEPDVGLSQPSTVTQLPDGRLRVAAREWNRDRYWQITERERSGAWGPWRLCGDSGCA